VSEPQPVEILTAAECRALIRHCGRGVSGERNRAIVAMLWRTGLRAAECLNLRPRDVNLERGTVRVRKGKGKRTRTVGLDSEPAALLERWLAVRGQLSRLAGDAPIFCTLRGDAIHPSYLRQLFPRLARRAGITKRVHAHALRHTFAVELSRELVPVAEIQKALGHYNVKTTSGYLEHLEPRELVDLMRRRVVGDGPDAAGGRQGSLAFPETHNATIGTHARTRRGTAQEPGDRLAHTAFLELCARPKCRPRRKR
jgi:integrase